MSTQVVSFDDDELTVISRDDGEVQIELRSKINGSRRLSGILVLSAEDAISLGVSLLEKGQALQDAIAEQQRQVFEPKPGVSD